LRARSVAALCLLAVAGCGGGERQDENEPEGNFPVEVVRASFPDHQKLAQSSNLVVTVRNAGDETIPNIAVTVNGLDRRKKDPDLADPSRPVFALNGVQVEIAGQTVEQSCWSPRRHSSQVPHHGVQESAT
jgi:hypothetical protein